MKKNEFARILNQNFGHFTAFVFDSPNNRFQYSSGEIDDNVFEDAPEDGYQIVGIDDLPEVKRVIADNFLAELEPAEGVYDENFETIKNDIEMGNAQVGYWSEDSGTTYILFI